MPSYASALIARLLGSENAVHRAPRAQVDPFVQQRCKYVARGAIRKLRFAELLENDLALFLCKGRPTA
jgi:hypothetical protein